MGASEIDSFMSKNYETCVACNKLKETVSFILDYCLENFSNNFYIIDYKERLINAQECTHNLQEPVKEEIAETEKSLDEKGEESDEQKEEVPSNESNSLTLTLFDHPPFLSKEDECYIPVDSLEIFSMSKTCENNYDTVIYDNPCYFDKSYDNPLFVPNIDMHGNEKVCLENAYDKALDDGPILLDNIMYSNENGDEKVLTLAMSPISFESDQSSYYKIVKSGFENYDPTILELDKNYVFVDHEKHALCDSYIVEFLHNATENYYDRGKYGFINFHGIKTPLFMLKVLKLYLFNLSMLVALCFNNLFCYKMPLHRKWVRLKCV